MHARCGDTHALIAWLRADGELSLFGSDGPALKALGFQVADNGRIKVH